MSDFEPPWCPIGIYPKEVCCAHSGYDVEVFLGPIHSCQPQVVVVGGGGCSKLSEVLTHLIWPESSMCGMAGRH